MPKRRVTYAGKLEKQLSLYFKTDPISDPSEDGEDGSGNENGPLRKNSSLLFCDSSSTEEDEIEGDCGGTSLGEHESYLIPTNEIEEALYSYEPKTVFIPTGDRQNEVYFFGDQNEITDPVDMINSASFDCSMKENALSRRARRRKRMAQRMNLSNSNKLQPRKGAIAARQTRLKSPQEEVTAPVEEKPKERFEVRTSATGTQVFDHELDKTVINHLNDKTLAKFISEKSLHFGGEMELLTAISNYQQKIKCGTEQPWAGVDLYRIRLQEKASENERSISPTRPVEGALLEDVVGMVMEKYLSTQEMEAAHREWRKLLTRQTCYERYLVRKWEQKINDLITIKLKLVLTRMEQVSDGELHLGLTQPPKKIRKERHFHSRSSDINSEVQEVMKQINIGPIAVGQGTMNGQETETATTSDTGEDVSPIISPMAELVEPKKRAAIALKIPRPYTVAQNKRCVNLRYFAMIEKRPYKALPEELERLPPLTIMAFKKDGKHSDLQTDRQMLKTQSTGRLHVYDGSKLVQKGLMRSRSDFPGGVLPDIHTANTDFTEGCGEVGERREGEIAIGDSTYQVQPKEHCFPHWPKQKKIRKVKKKKKKRIKKKLPRFSMPIERFGKKSRMNVNISLAMDGTRANVKATIRPNDHHKTQKKVQVNVTIDIGSPENTDPEAVRLERETPPGTPQKKKPTKRKRRKPTEGREILSKNHLALPPRSPSRRSNHPKETVKKKRPSFSYEHKPYVRNSPSSPKFRSPYHSPAIHNIMSDPESRLRASNNRGAKSTAEIPRSPSRSSIRDGDRLPSRRKRREIGLSHSDGSYTFANNSPPRNNSYTDARTHAFWGELRSPTKNRKSEQTRIDQILADARRRYNHQQKSMAMMDTSPLIQAAQMVARRSYKTKRKPKIFVGPSGSSWMQTESGQKVQWPLICIQASEKTRKVSCNGKRYSRSEVKCKLRQMLDEFSPSQSQKLRKNQGL